MRALDAALRSPALAAYRFDESHRIYLITARDSKFLLVSHQDSRVEPLLFETHPGTDAELFSDWEPVPEDLDCPSDA